MSSSAPSQSTTSPRDNESGDDKRETPDGAKNDVRITCTICNTIILRENDAVWKTGETRDLPNPTQKKGRDSTETETLEGWWTVTDMYAFENVGFTNAVDGRRFLTCGECDFGPIGFVDGAVHYVAPKRVKEVVV